MLALRSWLLTRHCSPLTSNKGALTALERQLGLAAGASQAHLGLVRQGAWSTQPCTPRVHSRRHLRVNSSSSSSSAITAKTPVTDIVKRVTKDDVMLSYARSGGAGGQNVNKVNTKVDLRLDVAECEWLSEDMKDAVKRQNKNRMNKMGELVLNSTASRSQQDNVEDALGKLQACLDAAAQSLIPIEIDPETKKKLAKQKKVANEKRLDNKKKASTKKADRRSKGDW